MITGDEICEPEKMCEVVTSGRRVSETSSVREEKSEQMYILYTKCKQEDEMSECNEAFVERSIRTEARIQDALSTNNVYKK